MILNCILLYPLTTFQLLHSYLRTSSIENADNGRKINSNWQNLQISVHCEFLEYWNTQKSVWMTWQRFSCLLEDRIPKIWKKLNSHDGFWSYLQNSTANSAHLAAHFCPALVCPQKATVRIQFLSYFWNPLIK